jgi:hypothetical protein
MHGVLMSHLVHPHRQALLAVCWLQSSSLNQRLRHLFLAAQLKQDKWFLSFNQAPSISFFFVFHEQMATAQAYLQAVGAAHASSADSRIDVLVSTSAGPIPRSQLLRYVTERLPKLSDAEVKDSKEDSKQQPALQQQQLRQKRTPSLDHPLVL